MKKMYYEICSCNPANGGNGICGCTMGNRLVDTENTYTTITTTTTGALIDKIKPQMKQTAVEWLFAHLLPFLPFSDPKEREHFRRCLSEAKAMEKEQLIKAVDSIELVNRRYYKDGTFGDDKAGKEIQMTGREYIGLSTDGKAYYNETYGGEE